MEPRRQNNRGGREHPCGASMDFIRPLHNPQTGAPPIAPLPFLLPPVPVVRRERDMDPSVNVKRYVFAQPVNPSLPPERRSLFTFQERNVP